MVNVLKKVNIYLVSKSISGIQWYQKHISPDHSHWAKSVYPGGYCKFSPSCSNYGVEALKKYGFLKGWLKIIWRVIRCNPFSKGGEDKA